MCEQWKNSLKGRTCILALVVCATFGRARASTAIFAITPQGIVAGADQLGTVFSKGGGIPFSTNYPKIELIDGRFIVATVGLAELDVQSTDGPVIPYSFRDWIKAIGNKLPANASLRQLVSLVKDEAARTFKTRLNLEHEMRRGTFKKFPIFQCSLVEYVIAGYEAGVPTIVTVELEPDRLEHRLIGPIEETLLVPNRGAHIKFALAGAGEYCASSEFMNANSYAHKRFQLYRPATLDKIVARQTLAREEAADTIRVLIKIQSEITPDRVGGATRIIWVPVRGAGIATDYPKIPMLPQSLQ